MDGTIRSIEKRNQIVEQYLWCIDVVIRKNYALIAGAHLDRQDVYQALAVRLIRAVDGYDPKKGKSLKVHIFAQRNMKCFPAEAPRQSLGSQMRPTDFGTQSFPWKNWPSVTLIGSALWPHKSMAGRGCNALSLCL